MDNELATAVTQHQQNGKTVISSVPHEKLFESKKSSTKMPQNNFFLHVLSANAIQTFRFRLIEQQIVLRINPNRHQSGARQRRKRVSSNVISVIICLEIGRFRWKFRQLTPCPHLCFRRERGSEGLVFTARPGLRRIDKMKCVSGRAARRLYCDKISIYITSHVCQRVVSYEVLLPGGIIEKFRDRVGLGVFFFRGRKNSLRRITCPRPGRDGMFPGGKECTGGEQSMIT